MKKNYSRQCLAELHVVKTIPADRPVLIISVLHTIAAAVLHVESRWRVSPTKLCTSMRTLCEAIMSIRVCRLLTLEKCYYFYHILQHYHSDIHTTLRSGKISKEATCRSDFSLLLLHRYCEWYPTIQDYICISRTYVM